MTAWAEPRLPRWRLALADAVAMAAIVAVVAVVSVREVGPHRASITIAVGTLLAFAAREDVRALRAPNGLVYAAGLLAVAGAGSLGIRALGEALAGGGVAFVLLLLAAALGRGAMGLGDVKFGAVCGLVAGAAVVQALLTAFLAGAAVTVVVLCLRLRSRRDAIAFTPFLFAGMLVSLAAFGGRLTA